MNIAVYTDLDGTLLDHDSYSHAPADAMLQQLEAQGVPVVPCTSKTRAEMLPLRIELNNTHPFVVENGGAVFIPVDYLRDQPQGTVLRDGFWVKEFVSPRSHWLRMLNALQPDFEGDFESFSQLSTERLVALTGLTTEKAMLASRREYGEPLHWLGSEAHRAEFVSLLGDEGASVLQGGRFMHVSGACDKGKALRWLNRQLQVDGNEPVAIALGDSHNDIAMLEAADHAVIVRSPAHAPPQLKRTRNLLITQKTGPSGWTEALQELIDKLSCTRGNAHG